MRDLISVVVPAFNSAVTLVRAIESIRAQNWPDLELVVVDDGSSDDTAVVLKRLAAADLHIIRQENAGPGAARNRGIRSSTGRWVAFLDADDIWLPDKLKIQMDRFIRSSHPGFTYTDMTWRYADGAEYVHKPRETAGSLFADLLLGPQFGLSTAIIDRDCFDEAGLFDEDLRTGEDWDMWLRLSALYPGCYVPESLTIYSAPQTPDKYPLGMFEDCQVRILRRLFSNGGISRRWPQLSRRRSRLFSWHYAILAKSYLAQSRWPDFWRLAAASLRAHPLGVYFIARKWSTLRRWPDVGGISTNGR